MLHFSTISLWFSHLSIRLFQLNDKQLALDLLRHPRCSLRVAEFLMRVESHVGDTHVDLEAHHLFATPFLNLRIDVFQNDDHCENWTRFRKGKFMIWETDLGYRSMCISTAPQAIFADSIGNTHCCVP